MTFYKLLRSKEIGYYDSKDSMSFSNFSLEKFDEHAFANTIKSSNALFLII